MKFELNIPQVLSLLDPVGDIDGSQVLYQTSKGEISLPRHVAKKLDALKLSPGEEISICRYQRDGAAEWVVCLTPRSEKARAAAEAPELERQLAESLDQVRKGVMPSESVRRKPDTGSVGHRAVRELRPTGTDDGPVPKLGPKIAAKAAPGGPVRVSYRVALQDITETVLKLLAERKEQWESDPRQGLISTCFIAACKTGQIVFDFPEAA